ncbi:MAG: tetratricopeptide repeat protein [Rehaibacterium terrae]|uniref:tetratricopeptide repeat protein n=1 Tax=Rehaibacterium terrae TaxID=1341696 RepID=UPI00391BDDC3
MTLRKFKRLLPLFAASLLTCLAVSAQPPAKADPGVVLEGVLAGEFALQAGRLSEAAERYLVAATATGDVAVAERATQVALLANRAELAAAALERWLALDPQSQGALAARATLALRQGQADQAFEALRGLYRHPGDDGWRRAMQALVAAGAADTAHGVMTRLLEADALPDELQAWLSFGGLAQRLGHRELSLRVVERVVARFPDEPRAWLLKAGQLRQAGDDEGARAAIGRILQHAGEDTALRLAAAGEFDRLGDPRAAAEALARGPQDDQLYAARAAYLARAGDKEGLAALYAEIQAAGTERPDPLRRLLLGQLAEHLERRDEALRWYRSVPAGPTRGQARLRIALVLESAGDIDGAVRQLRELQVSEDEDGELVRDSYLLEAELHTRRGEYHEALAVYGRGLAIFEDDPRLLYGRALTHERLDDIAAAEADLRAILEFDPDNTETLNALGYTLADRTDRHEEALGYIERAYAADPDNPAIIDSLGWVLYRLGRVEEALRHLRRAFEMMQDAEIAAHLGEVLWVTGEHEAARAIWEQGRALDPDNRALRETLERFVP